MRVIAIMTLSIFLILLSDKKNKKSDNLSRSSIVCKDIGNK